MAVPFVNTYTKQAYTH